MYNGFISRFISFNRKKSLKKYISCCNFIYSKKFNQNIFLKY